MLFALTGNRFFCFSARARARTSLTTFEVLRDSQHVENQRDSAVAHDGRAGKGADAFEMFAQRFDDDFFGVVDVVDDETKLPFVCLQDDDVHRVCFGRIFWCADSRRSSRSR